MIEEGIRRIVREEIQQALESLGLATAQYCWSDDQETAAYVVQDAAGRTLSRLRENWAGLDPDDVRRQGTHESPSGEMHLGSWKLCTHPDCATHLFDDSAGGVWEHDGTRQDCKAPEYPFKEESRE